MSKNKKKILVPQCKIEFRDNKAIIVCDSKEDQYIAYSMVSEGVTIEVKPKVETK